MYAPATTAPSRVVQLRQPVVVAPAMAPGIQGSPTDQPAPQPMPMPAAIAAQAQTVAPVMPAPMPNAIAASRAQQAQDPAEQIQKTIAPIVYAMQKYQQTGSPFTAAAQGFVNATSFGANQAKGEQDRKEAAQLLKDHPDLQKQVEDGVLDLSSALTLAQSRDQTTKGNERKQQIIDYLKQSGDQDIADQFANGVLDEDGVSKALAAKDKTPTLTPEEKHLADINADRKKAGQPEMTMEEFLTKKKDGFGTETSALLDDLPVVQRDERGVPIPEQQQALLDALDPDTASIVKKVANYEMDLTKVTSLKGGEREKLAQLVAQYDPSFDMTQYSARQKARTAYSTGQQGQTITAANTVIGHLAKLYDDAGVLNASNFVPWNNVANAWNHMNSNTDLKQFDTDSNAVASELAKFFKGTGATDMTTQEEWRRVFDPNTGKDATQSNIKNIIGNLMKSRLDEMYGQYQQVMGKPYDTKFISAETSVLLKKMGIDKNSLAPEGPVADQADVPGDEPADAPKADASAPPDPFADAPTVSTQEEYDQLPSGAAYIELDDQGQPHKVRKP